MKPVRLLSCVAAIALVAVVAAPLANATCATPTQFSSAGFGTVKQGFSQVFVSPAGVTPLGDEIGRFWQANDSNGSNNFAGTCPATLWWQTGASGLQVNGDAGACAILGCPAPNALNVLVEDWGTPAPGIGGDAKFVLWQANNTPSLTRPYDLGRTAATGTVFPFVPFPTAHVASSGRNGMNIEVTINYADVAPNFHGVSGTCSGSTPATCTNNPVLADDAIVSYELMVATGMADPGRLRTGWTQVASIPYPGAGVPGVFQSVACPDTLNDAFIAVGMTFEGGAGPDVTSTLVGAATRLECDPQLADPQVPANPKKLKSVTPQRTAGHR